MLSSVFVKSLYTYPQTLRCISRAKVILIFSICLPTGTIVDTFTLAGTTLDITLVIVPRHEYLEVDKGACLYS